MVHRQGGVAWSEIMIGSSTPKVEHALTAKTPPLASAEDILIRPGLRWFFFIAAGRLDEVLHPSACCDAAVVLLFASP